MNAGLWNDVQMSFSLPHLGRRVNLWPPLHLLQVTWCCPQCLVVAPCRGPVPPHRRMGKAEEFIKYPTHCPPHHREASGAGSWFIWNQLPWIEGNDQSLFSNQAAFDSPATAFKAPDAWTSFTLIKTESLSMRPRHLSFHVFKTAQVKDWEPSI